MRTIILSILLAGAAATPALAQDHGRWHQEDAQGDRQQTREERQQAREQARAEHVDQGQPSQAQVEQRPQPVAEQRSAPQFEQRRQVEAGQQVEDRGRGFGGQRFDRAPQQIDAPQQAQAPQQGFDGGNRFDRRGFRGRPTDQAQQSGERTWNGGNQAQQPGERTWNRDDSGWTRRSGDLRQSDRPVPNVMRDRNPLIVSQTPREGTQPPLRTESRRYSESNWSTSWRNNRHYDWRNWRDRHRSTFHIGFYYDPFGWQYQPYQIGWRLWPSYYSRNYWINDPWQYRLPYAPPGTTWVRYWDDALLVDTYTGEVVDVIRNFFW
jgi:hypothetical protein